MVSMLVLDVSFWLTVEVDDAEDHSPIELEGDVLNEFLEDVKEDGSPDLPGGFLLKGIFDEAWITGLEIAFVLADADVDFWIFSVEVLLELLLEQEDLPTSLIVAPEEAEPNAFGSDAALGTLFRAPAKPAATGAWTCTPLPSTVIFIQFT